MSVRPILFSEFQQIKTLLETLHGHLNEASHRELLASAFIDNERLLESVGSLIKEVVQLVVIDLKVTNPHENTLPVLLDVPNFVE